MYIYKDVFLHVKNAGEEREEKMKLIFEKYHGLGNDYLVYDPQKNEMPLTQKNVQMICNRNIGLGADGILEGPVYEKDCLSVRIWNPDGSIAKQSGNGVRIFAKYLKDASYIQKKTYCLHTNGKPVEITYLNEEGSRLRVSMGKYSFLSDDIPVSGQSRQVINEDMVFGPYIFPVTCISVGNPHCVIPVEEATKELVCKVGVHSESGKYFPERINTELLEVEDRRNIKIETYERGAGYTMANGTGACAAAVVAWKLGLAENKVFVHMPGGSLQIEIDDEGIVYMTGEVSYIARIVVSGEFSEKLRQK